MPLKPLSPTAVARASRCLHAWTLDCFGDPALKREPDAGTLLRWERGREHEREQLKALPKYVQPTWDGKDWKAGFRGTVQLMQEGHPWIYQGVLLRENFRGLPDLLKKVKGPSSLGTYTYIPVDIKGHKSVTTKDRFQVLAYALLLQPVLGTRASRGGIWLNTGEIEEIDLTRYEDDLDALLVEMERVRAGKQKTVGYRCGECDTCPWLDVCSEEWEKTASVCLLYGVTAGPARKLADAGYPTWKAVARAKPAALVRAAGLKADKAQTVWLHAQAWVSGKPQERKPAKFPDGVPIHFYDIETYGSCTYLHGDIRISRSEREERQFTARSPEEEGEAWREFLEFLSRDERAVVYCWAGYEYGPVKALWTKYGGNRRGWKHLETMEDQCAFVRDHFALPVSSYSIKKVAPVFGFHWTAEDAGGLNSESWYRDWLASRDEKILAKILRYNLDDVLAMEAIDRALREECKAGGLDRRTHGGRRERGS